MGEKKPLKIAAAVKYDIENDGAPKIVASGRGHMADEIIKLAEDNDVPLYEDETLASLLATLELETEIPPELYALVAEVLSFVYKLERMKKKKQQIRTKLTDMKSKGKL